MAKSPAESTYEEFDRTWEGENRDNQKKMVEELRHLEELDSPQVTMDLRLNITALRKRIEDKLSKEPEIELDL